MVVRSLDACGRLGTLPPGFAAYRDAKDQLSKKRRDDLRMLVQGPTDAERAEHRAMLSTSRSTVMGQRISPELNRIWNHQAGVAEWRAQVDAHIESLHALRANGVASLDSLKSNIPQAAHFTLAGKGGEIVRIPYLNAILQDLLVVAANERAQYEADGISRLHPPGDLPPPKATDKPGVRNQLKRMDDTPELLRHVQALQRKMAEQATAGQAPADMRGGVTFALRSLLHVTEAQSLTSMHDGKPKTAMIVVDGANAAQTAFELKSMLDEADQGDTAVLVINAHTQHTFSDCPTYAIFHAEKTRTIAAQPTFDAALRALLDGRMNAAAYRLPWGRSDGASVFFIEDDNHPDSRLLPPAILKEMQSRKGLKALAEARDWAHITVNKTVNKEAFIGGLDRYVLKRYDASYVGERGQNGRSVLMVDKAIKYVLRARDALDSLEMYYSAHEADALLKQMLDDVRSVGAVGVSRGPDRAALLAQHAKACAENVELLRLDEQRQTLSHERYLIEQVMSEMAYAEDDSAASAPDDGPTTEGNDAARLSELAVMAYEALEELDSRLEREEQILSSALDAALTRTDRAPGFLGVCERRGVTAQAESRRLADLQALRKR